MNCRENDMDELNIKDLAISEEVEKTLKDWLDHLISDQAGFNQMRIEFDGREFTYIRQMLASRYGHDNTNGILVMKAVAEAVIRQQNDLDKNARKNEAL